MAVCTGAVEWETEKSFQTPFKFASIPVIVEYIFKNSFEEILKRQEVYICTLLKYAAVI